MLDLGARGGLPVPQGGILQDEFFRICLNEGLVELVGERVVVPDPVWLFEVLYRDIRFPRLKGSVALRSATAAAAGTKGLNHSQLDIDPDHPQQMAHALRKIWSALEPTNESVQMDVVVMLMVDTQTRGTAGSLQDNDVDETTFTTEAPALNPEPLSLPRLRTFGKPTPELPLFARRLQRLLAGVRRTFGRGDYVVDWVDDGQICWLIQIR